MSKFSCPQCGASISPNALSCQCGWRKAEARNSLQATARTKRSEPNENSDTDFDYDQFVQSEFGTGKWPDWFWQKTPREQFWWVIAVIVLITFTVTMVLL